MNKPINMLHIVKCAQQYNFAYSHTHTLKRTHVHPPVSACSCMLHVVNSGIPMGQLIVFVAPLTFHTLTTPYTKSLFACNLTTPPPPLPPSSLPRTVAYEMATMERPYRHHAILPIIWEVGNGRIQPLTHIGSWKLRGIVASCWTVSPRERDTFEGIVENIERNVSLAACWI